MFDESVYEVSCSFLWECLEILQYFFYDIRCVLISWWVQEQNECLSNSMQISIKVLRIPWQLLNRVWRMKLEPHVFIWLVCSVQDRLNSCWRWSLLQRVQHLDDEEGIGYGTHDLLHCVGAKFFPRIFFVSTRNNNLQFPGSFVRPYPSLLFRVFTGNESWIYSCDPENKQQSFQWKSPSSLRLRKVQQVKTIFNSMILIFFDEYRILQKEFFP